MVHIHYLVGETDELVEHCNKLDWYSRVLEKFSREKFYPGLGAMEVFLEELTSEIYLNQALAQARYRIVCGKAEKKGNIEL